MAKRPLDLPANIAIADSQAFLNKEFAGRQLIGVDEAGRGPLAGPVVAACVVWDDSKPLPEILRDSKKLSEKKRELLYEPIKEHALAWGIGVATPQEIDDVNILQATFLSMKRALDQIELKKEALVFVDGNQLIPLVKEEQYTVVKGDDKLGCIAAASILAKVYRDHLMDEYHEKHPQYQWNKNRGYGSVAHRLAMVEFGSTEHHRKTFKYKIPEVKSK